jgi:bile acid:Na+ symporter, BASS family
MEDFVRVAVLISIALLVLALGMETGENAALWLLRRPVLLARAALSMFVVMPLLVLALVGWLDLKTPVEVALLALALSPVPPFLPKRELKVSSRVQYVVALLVASAVLAAALAPISEALLVRRYGDGRSLEPGLLIVLRVVLLTVLLPLGLGVLLKRIWRKPPPGLLRILNLMGLGLLALAFVPILLKQWREIIHLLGDGTLLAIVLATVVGLLVGHVLGGPDPEDRSVLALATACRHPGVAIAVATVAAPHQRVVLPAVLLALLVSALAVTPYVSWRKRWRASFGRGAP